MLKIENMDVYGWDTAIRGMRNPMNSWDKSDSVFAVGKYSIGPEDEKLMRKLANAGPDHGKFLRMIVVTMDVVAPRYWWAEYDTYKVGTVANSCSTMHKLTDKEFDLDDFSYEHLDLGWLAVMEGTVIPMLNRARKQFLKTKYKRYWWQMIQLLPQSYNQRRTVMLNYAVLQNMYQARKQHKLDEWREFCAWIETLPYAELITGKEADT